VSNFDDGKYAFEKQRQGKDKDFNDSKKKNSGIEAKVKPSVKLTNDKQK
jgi:hypothetical protein